MQRRIGHFIVPLKQNAEFDYVSPVEIRLVILEVVSKAGLQEKHDEAVQPGESERLKLKNKFAEEFTKRIAQKSADLVIYLIGVAVFLVLAHWL